MQVLKVVIENLADCLDSTVQVNHYLAELYNRCYVAKKKMGPEGDPRCFRWALSHRDQRLLVAALPERENKMLIELKKSILKKGDHQLFTWIATKLPGFVDSSISIVIYQEDLATFGVMLDHVKPYWNDVNFFLCQAAEFAAKHNRAQFFPKIIEVMVKRPQWFPTIPQDMIEYENDRVRSAFTRGALQGGHPLPKLEE